MSTLASRRQVLAAIALADVPMPSSISFINNKGVLSIRLDRISDLHPWAELTGATAEQLGRALADVDTYTNSSSGELRRQTSLYPNWMGWRISLIAVEPAADPVEPLDDATREQLAAIATAPAHYHVAGWGGVPGECGVECACGVVFDHFGTIAEAAALLDDHIAAQAEGGAR